MNSIVKLLDNIDSVMYYPILIIVMAIAGAIIRSFRRVTL